MQRYKMMTGILLGVGLEAGTADPGATWPAFASGSTLSRNLPDNVQLVRGGDREGP